MPKRLPSTPARATVLPTHPEALKGIGRRLPTPKPGAKSEASASDEHDETLARLAESIGSALRDVDELAHRPAPPIHLLHLRHIVVKLTEAQMWLERPS